jgi:hypothetical protein
MISVSQEQLDTVEYLIQQSTQGNHVLFELDLVRQVFTRSLRPMSESEAYEVEHHIEKIIELSQVDKQKAYLDKLPEEILHRVIKTYFNIVENSMFESSKERH